jgi:hypothetical protein
MTLSEKVSFEYSNSDRVQRHVEGSRNLHLHSETHNSRPEASHLVAFDRLPDSLIMLEILASKCFVHNIFVEDGLRTQGIVPFVLFELDPMVLLLNVCWRHIESCFPMEELRTRTFVVETRKWTQRDDYL